MNAFQQYNAIQMAQKELDHLMEAYEIPRELAKAMDLRWHEDEKLGQELKRLRQEWRDAAEAIMGRRYASETWDRAEWLVNNIRENRIALKDTETPSFQKRCDNLLRRTRSAANAAFLDNEGKQFDFHINSAFREKGGDLWSCSWVQSNTVYHGNNRIPVWRFIVTLTPNYLKRVHEHFRFFMNGKHKCWVLNAVELNDHAYNDQGYRVFRAECLGYTADSAEPLTYNLYLIDAPDYKGENGYTLFAHGETVNAALNLLKRRIKSETLKRLSL
jgi:hypothetical protein